MIFVTSDIHFSHSNIIKYCNRPFENIFEMIILLKNGMKLFHMMILYIYLVILCFQEILKTLKIMLIN